MNKVNDVVIITTGRILAMATSIVSIRIFTTLLSPSEVGRLNIILAVYGWFGLVLLNPIGMYVNRKIIEWYKEKTAITHLISLGKYFLMVSLLSIIFVSVFKTLIAININQYWLVALIAGCIILNSGNSAYSSYLNLLGQRFLFVLISILTLWIGLIFSIFLSLWKACRAEYWLTGQLIGQGLLLIATILILSKFLGSTKSLDIKPKNDFSIPVVFKFAWPLSIGVFFYWIHTQGYRFIFQKIAGIEALGLFAVGFGIGSNLMVAFDTLFNQYYHPIFYNEIANSNEEQRTIAWNKYGSFFFPAIIIMMVYIGVNGPLLSKVFTGERFHYVGNIILWGAVAESLRMMTSATAMVSHAQLEMKPLIIPSIVGAVSAIIGVFILVRFNPFLGGGFAISFGWLLAFLVLFKNMKKLLPIEFPYKRVLYSMFLSSPFFVLMLIKKTGLPIVQSLIILILSGLYLIFAQFILARKWISLPLRLSFIDEWENKFKNYFSQITNL